MLQYLTIDRATKGAGLSMFLNNTSVVIAQQHCQQNIARSIQIPKDPKNLQSRSTRGKKEEREAMRAGSRGQLYFEALAVFPKRRKKDK